MVVVVRYRRFGSHSFCGPTAGGRLHPGFWRQPLDRVRPPAFGFDGNAHLADQRPGHLEMVSSPNHGQRERPDIWRWSRRGHSFFTFRSGNPDQFEGRITLNDYQVDLGEFPEITANDLKNLRWNLGDISQKAFAKLLGVSVKTIQAWEAGRNQIGGAARGMLYLIGRYPEEMIEMLVKSRQTPSPMIRKKAKKKTTAK